METKNRNTLVTMVLLAGALLAMPAFAAETGTLYPEGHPGELSLERP